MLFIYGALPVGGIETFFLRMAKERFNKNLSTSILLLAKPEQSNQELLGEMKKYANVIFSNDIFYGPSLFCERLPLLMPIKQKIFLDKLREIDQIHVSDGMHALLGSRLAQQLEKNLPITVGFYHYIKYLWGGNKVAWHEKVNRNFVFNYLPDESLLFFSEGNRDLYLKHKQQKFEKSKTFRLGVIDKKNVILKKDLVTPLKIAAVGRLVEFKTYNFYMVDVVKKLIDKGIDVRFAIYGDGPLKQQIQEKINKANLQDKIVLKGTLDYSKFDLTVSSYDLFIGSGTAIIQASSLGVPCITGIENMIEPKTYGYFCDVWQYEYNLKGLDLPLLNVEDIIYDFVNGSKICRKELKERHNNCVDSFTNESCQNSMDILKNIEMPKVFFNFNRWIYELSRVVDRINMRFNSSHPMRNEFKDFGNINEK
ncbi:MULTISPECIES: glycosyltransferase [unclassified Shewanella]|uniref:glycosyltransferase n=1 Tax=unclassified Shewanella TaxID=196818 RepID=UPI0021D9AD2B|nr:MULTISPECIES: glycosyltransferase [unclassified Shewanella]MCU7961487.1 glycosyltransferase [Shewanella sp. SW32]MCU7969569.1 glycosyltransferase [Shewanella sp. SW29]MCU8001464.1 glycosyltransferase [Shewanella sp. SM96]MCU8059852.1 glycosyltransferase [Shewanella sp. SM55]